MEEAAEIASRGKSSLNTEAQIQPLIIDLIPNSMTLAFALRQIATL